MMNRVLFSVQVVLVVALAGSVLEFEDAGGSCTITKVAGALQSSCTLTDPARLNFEQSVSTRLDDLEALTVGFSDRIDDLEAAVDQVSTPALTDKDTVSLIDYETGAKLEWSGAAGRINGAASVGSSQWHLKKCVFGDCSTGALGSASQWTSAGSDASELKTCDVVAWFSTNSHRVYDCAWGTCTSQSYPLPSGNWGSPYKIRKQGHACGQPIKNHDEIYFSRMYSGVFVDSYYLACTTGQCRGTTDGTKTSFSIVRQEVMPTLSDKDTVTLRDSSNNYLEWSGGSGRVNIVASASSRQWQMKKCTSGSCSAGALGSASQWTTAGSDASELKTCDVVAWFSTHSQRVYDCAWGACTSQPYPLPGGHWGSPYKIRQVGQACGQPIKNHDEIYFSRMYSGVFVDSYYLACTTGQCRGTTDGAKTLFRISNTAV